MAQLIIGSISGMSKNRKERQAYAYLHGNIDKVDISVLKKWNRHNFDIGDFRALRKQKTERIMNKEITKNINI